MSSKSTSSDSPWSSQGRKLLKTGVKVLGRFLLSPDENFNAMVARQLIDKAKGNAVSVGTELRLFDFGLQLGDRATFVGLPVEFIRYHRLKEMISLTNEPRTLVVCVGDYDQRCVTILRFKDPVSLKVVTDVVRKRRAAYMEKIAQHMPLLTSTDTINQQVPISAIASERDLVPTNGTTEMTEDHVDTIGGTGLHPDYEIDNDEHPDYAVLRRRQIEPLRPPPHPAPQLQLQTAPQLQSQTSLQQQHETAPQLQQHPAPQMQQHPAPQPRLQTAPQLLYSSSQPKLRQSERTRMSVVETSSKQNYQSQHDGHYRYQRLPRTSMTPNVTFDTPDGAPNALLNRSYRPIAKVTDLIQSDGRDNLNGRLQHRSRYRLTRTSFHS